MRMPLGVAVQLLKHAVKDVGVSTVAVKQYVVAIR